MQTMPTLEKLSGPRDAVARATEEGRAAAAVAVDRAGDAARATGRMARLTAAERLVEAGRTIEPLRSPGDRARHAAAGQLVLAGQAVRPRRRRRSRLTRLAGATVVVVLAVWLVRSLRCRAAGTPSGTAEDATDLGPVGPTFDPRLVPDAAGEADGS